MDNKNEWKTAGSSGETLSAKALEEKGPVTGIYLTKEENVGDNNSTVYNIETKDGMIGIWGSAVLDSKFRQIRPGQEVRVEYMGLQKNPKTGRNYHDYDVKFRDAPFTTAGADVNLDDLLN